MEAICAIIGIGLAAWVIVRINNATEKDKAEFRATTERNKRVLEECQRKAACTWEMYNQYRERDAEMSRQQAARDREMNQRERSRGASDFSVLSYIASQDADGDDFNYSVTCLKEYVNNINVYIRHAENAMCYGAPVSAQDYITKISENASDIVDTARDLNNRLKLKR